MRSHCKQREAQVDSGIARNGGVRIAYEDFGKRQDGRCC